MHRAGESAIPRNAAAEKAARERKDLEPGGSWRAVGGGARILTTIPESPRLTGILGALLRELEMGLHPQWHTRTRLRRAAGAAANLP